MDGCQVGLDECYGDRAPKLHDVVVCASLFVSGLGEKCGQCCRGGKTQKPVRYKVFRIAIAGLLRLALLTRSKV